MKPNKNISVFRKTSIVLIALVCCLSLTVTALSATGILKGFFQNVTDERGAIKGTSYEQASDEISMDVSVNDHELTVLMTFADPQAFPYRSSERLGVAAYQIVDERGWVVREGAAESASVANGQATAIISLDGIENGSYSLVVTALVSEKKADQPLVISGRWECAFTH